MNLLSVFPSASWHGPQCLHSPQWVISSFFVSALPVSKEQGISLNTETKASNLSKLGREHWLWRPKSVWNWSFQLFIALQEYIDSAHQLWHMNCMSFYFLKLLQDHSLLPHVFRFIPLQGCRLGTVEEEHSALRIFTTSVYQMLLLS